MDRPLAVVALAVLLVTAGCSATSGGAAGGTDPGDATTGTPVTVTTVVDGDTVKVRYRNGSTDTVRLLGVDTPETQVANDPPEFEGVPDTEAGRDCLRAAGHDATRFVTERVLGESVRLRGDPLADARDRYDRRLAYVLVDGASLNYRLVAAGHARVYDSEFTEADRFYAAEDHARNSADGLWTCATDRTPVPTDGLAVARVHPDAAGDDRGNLNDEYVVLENRGETTLSLSGWTVTDEAGKRYRFPDGTTLAPGADLTLRSGAGTDTETDRYWDAGGPVWNNDGDTVTVRDRNGTVRATRSY